MQSIYTLARLASSSSRVRRTTGSSNGPTIMDFMQCINFKSRLDREREMIRRKIRSSTLYRKPSFSKSGYSIYNANGDISKVSCISKNIKINEFGHEPLRKVKSPLLVGDEVEDENSNDDKGILCIGNKYLDLTSNLLTSSLGKSVSTSTLSLINNELSAEKSNDTDFERAISQSHLSPSSQSMCHSPNNLFLKKQVMREADHMQENLIKPKTAKALNVAAAKSDDSKTPPTDSNDGEETQDFQSPSASEQLKRKDHNKLIKKSTHSFYAVGVNVGKYSDAQKTEVALDDLANSIVTNNNNQNKTHNTSASSKAKKSGVSSHRKKSSHSKKSDKNSPKTAKKSESS